MNTFRTLNSCVVFNGGRKFSATAFYDWFINSRNLLNQSETKSKFVARVFPRTPTVRAFKLIEF